MTEPPRPHSPSPFFSLPDVLDDSNDAPQAPIIPPMTVSCVECDKILGDSSAFLCTMREIGGITLSTLINIKLGRVRMIEEDEGGSDALWFVFTRP